MGVRKNTSSETYTVEGYYDTQTNTIKDIKDETTDNITKIIKDLSSDGEYPIKITFVRQETEKQKVNYE